MMFDKVNKKVTMARRNFLWSHPKWIRKTRIKIFVYDQPMNRDTDDNMDGGNAKSNNVEELKMISGNDIERRD